MSETAVVTLTEFLLARIAEDERVARAATSGPWRWEHLDWDGTLCVEGQDYGHHGPDLVSDGAMEEGLPATVAESWGHDEDGLMIREQDGAHIAGWDPARVLADCEAKRRIVALHADDQPYCSDNFSNADHGFFEGPCENLRLLALPYADHPDYRDEWKP